MPVGANPGPRADDRPPEGDPQPRRARRSRAGDTMTSSSAQLCRGCVGGPRLTAAHRKHLGRSSRPARIALSGRGRRELRIERRDSAVFRSGGRPVYRKAGRLTPPSSVEVGVVGRSHHRFYWSNRVLMQRLAPMQLLCRLAYRFGRRRRHDDPTALAVPVHGLCVQNHDARRVRRLVPGVIYPARPMRRFRPEGDPPPVACREEQRTATARAERDGRMGTGRTAWRVSLRVFFKAARAARTSACSSHADRASPGAMLAHFETLSTTATQSANWNCSRGADVSRRGRPGPIIRI